MRKVKHLQTTITFTNDYQISKSNVVYLPLSKKDKLSLMGKDYSWAGNYKKTSSSGLVLIGDIELKKKVIISPVRTYKRSTI